MRFKVVYGMRAASCCIVWKVTPFGKIILFNAGVGRLTEVRVQCVVILYPSPLIPLRVLERLIHRGHETLGSPLQT